MSEDESLQESVDHQKVSPKFISKQPEPESVQEQEPQNEEKTFAVKED
jgi:hypothetical protein